MQLCIPEHYLLFKQSDPIGHTLLATGACLHVFIKHKSVDCSLGLHPRKKEVSSWLIVPKLLSCNETESKKQFGLLLIKLFLDEQT